MNLDWHAFTPWTALGGGALIGLAAAAFALLTGRIAGVSGILGDLLNADKANLAWRAAFLAGLVAAPAAWRLFAPLPVPTIAGGPVALIVAGLLVGVGTRMGSGCTSGHGVCGLSRRSPRSLAATLAFMGAGFATVFMLRHLVG